MSTVSFMHSFCALDLVCFAAPWTTVMSVSQSEDWLWELQVKILASKEVVTLRVCVQYVGTIRKEGAEYTLSHMHVLL